MRLLLLNVILLYHQLVHVIKEILKNLQVNFYLVIHLYFLNKRNTRHRHGLRLLNPSELKAIFVREMVSKEANQ
jgi:hypothetical protein